MGVRGYGGPLTREGGGRAGPPAVRDENARGARPPRGPAGRRGRLCACAARGPYPSGVRCSTDQEEWLPRGHRFRTEFSRRSENQALTRFVRDREWCPVAITNSLCVNRVRVSQLLNTAESLLGMLRPVLAGTRCYIAST